jgi:sarcosine oxidase
MRIAVVGAGIVGLTTVNSLLRAGTHDVRCYEPSVVMGARSAGDTRVFRISHSDPALVEFAIEARSAWKRWSDDCGHQLLEQHGQFSDLADIAMRRNELQAHGVPAKIVEGTTQLAPITSALIGKSMLWDPWAGVIRADAAGRYLRSRVASTIVPQAVVAVDVSENGKALVRTANDEWKCDEVLIAAGVQTPAIAATCDVDVPVQHEHAARFTFRMEDADSVVPNWTETFEKWSMWGLTTKPGHWAMGIHWDGEPADPSILQADSDAARLYELEQYIARRLDRVNPIPTDVMSCVADSGGDGIHVRRRGPVLVVWGDNLFKFAPVLGPALSDALTRAELPAMPMRSVG